jgi:hypothetical protein
MLIFYEGYCVEISECDWDSSKYWSEIFIPCETRPFRFYGYGVLANSFEECLKKSFDSCEEITSDYGLKPPIYQELDLWELFHQYVQF